MEVPEGRRGLPALELRFAISHHGFKNHLVYPSYPKEVERKGKEEQGRQKIEKRNPIPALASRKLRIAHTRLSSGSRSRIVVSLSLMIFGPFSPNVHLILQNLLDYPPYLPGTRTVLRLF